MLPSTAGMPPGRPAAADPELHPAPLTLPSVFACPAKQGGQEALDKIMGYKLAPLGEAFEKLDKM